jgi:hypothetical protein
MGIEKKACVIIRKFNPDRGEVEYCATHASWVVFESVGICDDGAFFLRQRVQELIKENGELRGRVKELEKSAIDQSGCDGDCQACQDDPTSDKFLQCKVFPND